jgi:uncharacterized membrane protein YdjX (TVP38/TMEM64 family)|eukprot:COSAG06_NODE_177_length_21031_cov_13.839528_11_plen_99_part_00
MPLFAGSFQLGVALGAFAVFIGATLGATASFLLARFVFRDMAADMIKKYPTMLAIDRAVGSRGLRMVILVRLSPIIPFNVLNYVCGATSLELRDFVVG